MPTPFPCHQFGGLNLRDAPDEVGASGAIDLLNVELDRPGVVRSRDGYDNLTSSALTNNVASLQPYYTTGGTAQLLAGCGTRLEAINTSGAVVNNVTGLTGSGSPWDFARFGAPGSEVAYAVNSTNRMHEWDGANWTTSGTNSGMRAKYAAVMAVDQGNRMVLAGFPDSATANPNGGQSYTSQVWFSDPGAPETYSANNFQQLTPGDGELIQNVIAWREFVIVFKESKFFVFYGASTDADGNPIFNYRTVDTGIGLTSPRAVTAGPGGVYFMARDGIYVTTGGDPTLISGEVGPIWTGGASSFYSGTTMAPAGDKVANAVLHHHQGRLYFAFTSGTLNEYMLVHNLGLGWWSGWNIAAASLASFRTASGTEELVFGYSASNHIGVHSRSFTTDDGAAITARYRTGFYDAGVEEEKELTDPQLWGTGAVGFSLSRDFGALPTATNVTLGTSPAIAPARARVDKRGALFSHQFASVTGQGAWAVHRCTPYIRELRGSGGKT